MTEEKKPVKVTFVPGCFDQFDGTQEELDELMQQIQEMADSGELGNQPTISMVDDLLENLSEEEMAHLLRELGEYPDEDRTKHLH
jgi:hypothetical protein